MGRGMRLFTTMRRFIQKLGLLLLATGWLPLNFLCLQERAASPCAIFAEQRASETAFKTEPSNASVQFHQFRAGKFQRWNLRGGPEPLDFDFLSMALVPGNAHNAVAIPRLAHGWQFALRAAPNPRAPCIA